MGIRPLAICKDGETAPLTMLFRFREDGLIDSVRAEARDRVTRLEYEFAR